MNRLWLLLLLTMLPACVTFDDIGDHACPSAGTKLTYDNFGRGFMTRYCVYCHGGPNGYSSRALNTLESVRASRERIFANAAGQNRAMPPGPDDPSPAERDKLAEWLVCGAP